MKSQAIRKFKLPDTAGVYFFLGKNREILYIGRASSIRERVKSYFSKDIFETRGPLIEKMIGESRSIDFRKTDSVLEAVLLEADLIHKFKPPYNTRDKDDKSSNCVVITKEDFPRVLVARSRLLQGNSFSLHATRYTLQATYGPFPEGGKLNIALKLIRKIFPFRDRCEIGSSKPCFNRQIGLCPGVCSGEITEMEYRKMIKNIKSLFEGKKHSIIRNLKRDMKQYAAREEFDKAAQAKRSLFALEHIEDVALISSDTKTEKHLRIEAFDIAHTAGKEAVGVMVVVQNGTPKKSLYRTFTIRTAVEGDDVGALCEVLTRRMKHPEWGMPDLVVLDGGVAQLHAARSILSKYSAVRVVSVVKDEHHRPDRIMGDTSVIGRLKKEILLANHEAHRFALSRHRRRRGKKLLE